MIKGLIENLLPIVAKIGANPDDSDDLRLQKNLLTLGSLMFILAGALWGILYFSFGEFIAGSIPLGYALFSTLSLIVFLSITNIDHFYLASSSLCFFCRSC